MTFDCVLKAWHNHQPELRGYLIGQIKEPAMADDVLQDVFFKAMREGQDFCQLANPRAHGLSLPAAKARIQRARERFREALALRCNVILDASGNVCCHAAIR